MKYKEKMQWFGKLVSKVARPASNAAIMVGRDLIHTDLQYEEQVPLKDDLFFIQVKKGKTRHISGLRYKNRLKSKWFNDHQNDDEYHQDGRNLIDDSPMFG